VDIIVDGLLVGPNKAKRGLISYDLFVAQYGVYGEPGVARVRSVPASNPHAHIC
jgi:hypothetical protein